MNWYKAKTILIVFLVITNAFLLFNIIFNVKDGTYISDKTISETAAILHNNGIDIDESIIPHKNVNAGQFEADNIIEGYQSFAEKLLGENPEKISYARSSEYKIANARNRFPPITAKPFPLPCTTTEPLFLYVLA